MPDFTPPEKKRRRKKDEEETPFPLVPQVPKIEEPRCNVCKSDYRDSIDRLIAIGTSYAEISRMYSTDKLNIDHRSISGHAEKHLGYEDAAIRKLVQKEAQNLDEKMDLGISAALQRRALLDTAVQRGLDKLTKGGIELEFKDLIKAIELRDKLEKDSEAAAIETLLIQFHAFREAMLEKVPPEYYEKVLDRAREIAQKAGRGESPLSDPPGLNP